jgi:beta-lactam-binding protein with PASTA domain
MKAIAKLVLLGLVLLMVAMISALTAMRFAIHGHEVPVPNLVGMTVSQAERASVANGLEVQVERQYYSSSVAEGKIMSQTPEAGTGVRRGWQVRVAQSLGPQRVAIPDVTGETLRAAELNIEHRGLELGSTAVLPSANVPPDQVIAQSPPANAGRVAAPRISLLLSAAPATPSYLMPSLVGQSFESATGILESAGMRLGTVKVASLEQSAPNISTPTAGRAGAAATPEPTPSPSSLVLSQDPAAGQPIMAGSTVNFEVSR